MKPAPSAAKYSRYASRPRRGVARSRCRTSSNGPKMKATTTRDVIPTRANSTTVPRLVRRHSPNDQRRDASWPRRTDWKKNGLLSRGGSMLLAKLSASRCGSSAVMMRVRSLAGRVRGV